jgi:hypothetical protein
MLVMCLDVATLLQKWQSQCSHVHTQERVLDCGYAAAVETIFVLTYALTQGMARQL